MSTNTPKYIELYSRLRRAILAGEFTGGSFLPTEKQLMKEYGVSKTTVRHAVRMLSGHGLIEVKQGCGTRVLFLNQKTVTTSKYHNPDSVISVTVRYTSEGKKEVNNTKAVIDMVSAEGSVADGLDVSPGTLVYRIQRLQLVDGIPFGYMVNYTTEEATPDLNAKGDLVTNLYGHLFHLYGIRVSEIEETVDAINAGFMEARYLQVDTGTPLVLLRRIARGDDGPVEYCETTVRPDIFHMTIRVNSMQDGPVTSFL